MAFDNLSLLFRRGRHVLRRDGVIHFIKRSFLILIGFQYENVYIYENTLSESQVEPRIQGVTLKIISTSGEIDELMADGFDFSCYSDIEVLKKKVSRGAIPFCILYGRDIAHISWVALDGRNNADPVLSASIKDWQNEASIGPCTTKPRYYGMNLYSYTLSQICKFLRQQNKQVAKITTSKDNIPSRKGITKAGFKIRGEMRYLRLFHLKFRKERPIRRIEDAKC
ncbi:MAG: hypothetical protein DDT31_01525 [Syntrophomonadaceae bacterium]|nr:hypothetical protein [Bacillota bacterium]MBT9147699.1 hypothetical protein [Bacillota bacterium]